MLVSDGRFRLSWTTRPTGAGHARRHRHAAEHEHAANLDLDEAAHAAAPGPRRPRHRRRLGRPRPSQGRARPDRPGPDQRRRARPQGGGRGRRLERAGAARAPSRGRLGHATTSRSGATAPREGRPRDRPCSCASTIRSTRPTRGSTASATRSSRRRTAQQYGGYGGFTNFADPVVRQYQIDVAVAGSQGRRRRDPLRLRPPAGRAALDDGLPRAERARPRRRSSRSWPRPARR